MKKKVLLVLAVALLAIAVVGGVSTVAQPNDSHQPMKGKKLVGTGYLGYVEFPSFQQFQGHVSHFLMINPDCVENITIERLSIIKGDDTLIYEGPLYHTFAARNITDRTIDPTNVIREEVTTLAPHQTVDVVLTYIMPDGEGGWLTHDEAINLFLYGYYVEVFYHTRGLELIGFAEHTRHVYEAQLQAKHLTVWSTPMVNMEQEAKEK